jgi:hypothetical protein
VANTRDLRVKHTRYINDSYFLQMLTILYGPTLISMYIIYIVDALTYRTDIIIVYPLPDQLHMYNNTKTIWGDPMPIVFTDGIIYQTGAFYLSPIVLLF